MPKKLDTCMFCMCLPCECNGVTKHFTRAESLKSSSLNGRHIEIVELPKADVRAAMQAMATVEHPTREQETPEPPPVKEEEQPDPEWVEALNVLESMLHSEEKLKYHTVLNTVESRAFRWKNGN